MFIWPGLVTPFILLAVGFIFYKCPPKKINLFSGYRTARAIKSVESWKEANHFSAKLAMLFSLIVMALSAGISLMFGDSDGGVAASVIISPLLCIFAMIMVVVFTEKHLKKLFDR